jgi:hypothetical protein
MVDYPPVVSEKAQRLEQLLLRVAAGESLDALNAALGFTLDQGQLTHWQTKYEAGGRRWETLLDGRHGHPHKAHSAVREWLYARRGQDEQVRAPQLAAEVKDAFGVELSAGHINYLLRKRSLTAPPGRPYKQPPPAAENPEIPVATSASAHNAGLFFPRSGESGAGPRGGG